MSPRNLFVPQICRALVTFIVLYATLGGFALAVGGRGSTTHHLEGPAHVVDGDTLTIEGARVRLEGIDAPETGQLCARSAGGDWPCGEIAARALRRMIGEAEVRCDALGEDRYGRMLGRCTANGIELNSELVRRGLAWAFVKYSLSYSAIEAEAKAQRLGVWQAPTMPAWEWRERRWHAEAAVVPGGCVIKGNVGRAGRVYHLPWSPWYGLVRMDKSGVRWFCSEDEAIAAGWRPAYVR